ncbi:hypothetical protein BXQ17_03280 [Polaribacter sp. BM10]|uniref:DUF6438 domain-containing protein n=1 Tax=Polaribacter sp. BM10 TaxID=1529069 RepID=UPI00098B5FD2|nr:DUF6438 domain-containing protein [Polaribacter sp. BM10]AQS93158.1 hypothetical protein BXQ17_03280 [Polaribacter sp. BM10]
MKKGLLIIFIFTSTFVSANQIDSLKSSKDVEEFAKKVYPKFTEFKWSEFKIISTEEIRAKISCKEGYDLLEMKNWEKVDITNDGKTDLILTAYWGTTLYSYAIVDRGNNNFKTYRLSKNVFGNCELFKPIKKDDLNYLKTYIKKQEEIGLMEYEELIIKDTLVFKFQEFVELNKNPTKYRIKEIEFQTSGCYGSCPVFNLKINYKGNAEFNVQAYIKHKGKSENKIPVNLFNEIQELLEYIEVKKLKDNYSVAWTDDQTSYLTIRFNDNSTKKIRDYGMIGTFGLMAVYSKLTEIGKETEWN